MCNSFRIFMFVDQLLLVDVFSQLYYPTYAKKTTTEADFRYKEREKNLWLPLARSAGVLWAGESCFILVQIAVVGIFDL